MYMRKILLLLGRYLEFKYYTYNASLPAAQTKISETASNFIDTVLIYACELVFMI